MVRLHGVYSRADVPPLRRLEEELKGSGISYSHTTIRAALKGERIPRGGGVLVHLYELLCTRSGEEIDDTARDEFDTLIRAALREQSANDRGRAVSAAEVPVVTDAVLDPNSAAAASTAEVAPHSQSANTSEPTAVTITEFELSAHQQEPDAAEGESIDSRHLGSAGAAALTPVVATAQTRKQFAEALTGLRAARKISLRGLAHLVGMPMGTLASWFGGSSLPGEEVGFRCVLGELGVRDLAQQEIWLAALDRVRGIPSSAMAAANVPPYRGLEAFDTDDAAFFFGRADVVEQLVAQVESQFHADSPRIVFVVGVSGAGKSSVLNAGLIPQLSQRGRRHITLNGAPLPQLLSALADLPATPRTDVVIIDQFEEVWTLGGHSADLPRLFELITSPGQDGPVYVISLRADFYAHAVARPELEGVLEKPTVVVGPMTRDDLRAAIVEPARAAGMTIEDSLVTVLINESEDGGAGALPLLSHALQQTWQNSSRAHLSLSAYFETGGIAQAINQTAEAVYLSLTDTDKQLARRVFLRLVVVTEQGSARRRVATEELDGPRATETFGVLKKFAAHRLITLGQGTVEITHEALLTGWPRLPGWIEDNRVALLAHHRLSADASSWADAGRWPEYLWRANRLAAAWEWIIANDAQESLNSVEREFIDESQRHVSRARRRERIRRNVLGVGAAALIPAIIVAVVSSMANPLFWAVTVLAGIIILVAALE